LRKSTSSAVYIHAYTWVASKPRCSRTAQTLDSDINATTNNLQELVQSRLGATRTLRKLTWIAETHIKSNSKHTSQLSSWDPRHRVCVARRESHVPHSLALGSLLSSFYDFRGTLSNAALLGYPLSVFMIQNTAVADPPLQTHTHSHLQRVLGGAPQPNTHELSEIYTCFGSRAVSTWTGSIMSCAAVPPASVRSARLIGRLCA